MTSLSTHLLDFWGISSILFQNRAATNIGVHVSLHIMPGKEYIGVLM